MKKRIAAFAALIAVALPSTEAFAACARGNLVGNWWVHAHSESTTGPGWVVCALVVNRDGTIHKRSRCAGAGSSDLIAASGRLTFRRPEICEFAGRLVLDGTSNTIELGAMAADKFTATGLGSFEGGFFTFNFTKVILPARRAARQGPPRPGIAGLADVFE